MSNQKKTSKALQLLAQIVPKFVLERARDLSLQEEQEGRIKEYMGRNILSLTLTPALSRREREKNGINQRIPKARWNYNKMEPK